MAKTLDTVGAELANELGEHYGDIDVKEQFRAWIRSAYDELVGLENWDFVVGEEPLNTVSGVSTYALTANAQGVLSVVRDDTGQPLRFGGYGWVVTSGLDPADSGTPQRWFYGPIDETDALLAIRLHPVPSGVLNYTVRYRRALTALAGEANIPVPDALLTPIKWWVRAQYHDAAGDSEKWARAKSNLYETLRLAKKRFLYQVGPRVGPRYTDVPTQYDQPQFVIPEVIQ